MMKKYCVITGASQGIGAACAEIFHAHHYFVFLIARNKEKLEELHVTFPNSLPIPCDLRKSTDVAQAARLISSTLKSAGNAGLHCLVNNAGIFQSHSFVEGTDEIWAEQFETNVLGSVRITRELYPLLKKTPSAIINVSSTLGLKPSANTGAYSAMKAAMINWTISLAQESGPHNIRVNCVCPGIVDTPIHPFHSMDAEQKKQTLAHLNPLQPLGRIGQPDEIARSVFFLGSDRSSWTTGAVLQVDGGINIR